MLHLALHFLVPLVVAWVFYRGYWRYAFVVLIATMLVDADHLLADPIYDAARCSIGFHPLHTGPAMVGYALLFAVPLVWQRRAEAFTPAARALHLVGLGLLIHMALDALDCLV